MQEDRLDQAFEDHGWATMKQLLDQEMPVKRKKKRAWLLWFGLLTGVMISGMAYATIQWYSDVEPLALMAHHNPFPILGTSDAHESRDSFSDKLVTPQEVLPESPKNQTNPIANAMTPTKIQKATTVPPAVFIGKPSNQNTIPAGPEVILKPIFMPKPSVTHWALEKIETPTRSTSELFPPIAKLTTSYLEYGLDNLTASGIEPISQTSFHWSLVSHTVHHFDLNWQGIELGGQFGIRWSKRRPRWQINTGLLVQHFRHSGEQNVTYQTGNQENRDVMMDPSLDSSFDPVSSPTAVSGAKDTTVLKAWNANANYLTIPVSIQKYWSSRWSTSIGLDLGWRMPEFISDDLEATTSTNQNYNAYEPANQNLSSFKMGMRLNVNYRFTPNWGVSAGYQSTLNDLFLEEIWKPKRDYLFLGMKYDF